MEKLKKKNRSYENGQIVEENGYFKNLITISLLRL